MRDGPGKIRTYSVRFPKLRERLRFDVAEKQHPAKRSASTTPGEESVNSRSVAVLLFGEQVFGNLRRVAYAPGADGVEQVSVLQLLLTHFRIQVDTENVSAEQ